MIIQGSICNNPHYFLSHIYCIFSTFYFPLSSVSYLSGTLILLTFKYIMLHCYVERGNNNLQFLHSVLLLLSNHYISWWLFHCYIMSAEPLQHNSFFFHERNKLKEKLRKKEKERTFVVKGFVRNFLWFHHSEEKFLSISDSSVCRIKLSSI